MREVNWTALNVRLCEALDQVRRNNWGAPVHPNMISVDALLPLLAARGHFMDMQQRDGSVSVKLGAGVDRSTGLVSHIQGEGLSTQACYAMALAAAAALGVEVPYL